MDDGSAVLTFYYLFKLYLNDLYAVRDDVLDELNINNFNDLLIWFIMFMNLYLFY